MTDAVYRVSSPCECQALLEAELDENRNVLHGWASYAGDRTPAPANAVGPERDRFDIVWLCPVCGRNTLRLFYAKSLPRIGRAPALAR